jgi:hypothetical protein
MCNVIAFLIATFAVVKAGNEGYTTLDVHAQTNLSAKSIYALVKIYHPFIIVLLN